MEDIKKVETLLDTQEESQELTDLGLELVFEEDSSINDTGVVNLEDSDLNSQVYNPTDEDIKEFHESEKKAAIKHQVEQLVKSPQFQARIMFENYIESESSKRFISGQEKKRLKRVFLKNAQKGKYKKFFDQDFIDRYTEEVSKRMV